MPKSNDERLTEVEARMDAFLAEQDTFAADVGKLPEAIGLNFRVFRRDLEHRIDALGRRLDARIDKLDVKFQELNDKTDAMSSDISAMASDISAILQILGRRHGPKE